MEAKTMIRIVLVAILLIVLAGLACLGLVMCGSETPLKGARVAAVNTLLDQTGAMERADSELRAHVNEISDATGVPATLVETGIDMLDIQEWEAVVLPDGVSETASTSFDLGDQTVGITTYDDPSLVTVDAYGQTLTFEVPKSAQTFTELMPYAEGAKSLGLEDLIGLGISTENLEGLAA